MPSRHWPQINRKVRRFQRLARLKHGLSNKGLMIGSPKFWHQQRLLEPTWGETASLSKAQRRSRRERMRLERRLLGKQFPKVLLEASKPPRGRDPQTMGRAVRKALRQLKD